MAYVTSREGESPESLVNRFRASVQHSGVLRELKDRRFFRSKAQKELTKAEGVELTVRLDNGRVVAVIQELSRETYLSVGDRVRIITLHGKARVLPATT